MCAFFLCGSPLPVAGLQQVGATHSPLTLPLTVVAPVSLVACSLVADDVDPALPIQLRHLLDMLALLALFDGGQLGELFADCLRVESEILKRLRGCMCEREHLPDLLMAGRCWTC